jgi:hypothetical protein
MRKLLLSATTAALVGLGAAVPAHAGFVVVALTDSGAGGGSLVCNTSTFDLRSACLADGFNFGAGGTNFNEVSYSGAIFGYTASFTTTQTNLPGTSVFAQFNLATNNVVNNSSSGNLTFNATGYGFTLPAGPDLTMFGSQSYTNNVSPATGTVMSTFYVNETGLNPLVPANPGTFSVNCSNVLPTGTIGPTVNGGCDAGNVNFTRGTEFSVADVVVFNLAIGGIGVNTTSNAIITNRVPEPMTTALVGVALFGLALTTRRRIATK